MDENVMSNKMIRALMCIASCLFSAGWVLWWWDGTETIIEHYASILFGIARAVLSTAVIYSAR